MPIDLHAVNEELKPEVNELRERNAELERWCKAAILVIERGIELMPNEQLAQWEAVRAVLESYPVRDD